MMDPGDNIAAKREQEAAVVLKELLLSPEARIDELVPARRKIKLRSPVGLD